MRINELKLDDDQKLTWVMTKEDNSIQILVHLLSEMIIKSGV